ncbi:MAG: polysaccharide biosynthesis C-terminal domain-containing protein [Clostridiales bacterium]|nr:polysaccharide biosynthesis C-terminal domain-containing protein [Clostridiales bacterium]
MDKYKKLASNTIIFAIGTFSSKILSLILTFFYTRVLDTGSYGGATLIQNAVNILVPIVTLAVNSAALRFAIDKDSNKKRVFTTGLATTLIGFAIFCLFSPVVAKININDFNMGQYAVLLYVMLLGSSLRQLCQQFVRGSGHVKLFAVDGVIATATSAGFTFLYLGAFHWGIYGYILAIFTSDMLSVLFLFIGAKLWKYVDFRHSLKKDTVSPMLKYCIPLIPTIILWWIINVSDQYMVTYFIGVAESGLYTSAYKIPNFIIIFASIFIDAWQLSIVDEYQSEDKANFFSRVFSFYSGTLVIIGALLVTFCRVITSVYLGSDYYDSWHYVPILLIATLFSCLVNFFASVYMAEKKSTLSMATACVGAVVNVVLNLVLIPTYSSYGAAVATATSFIVVFIIRIFNTRQFIKLKTNWAKFLLSVGILAAMCAVTMLEIAGQWQSMAICCTGTALIAALNFKSLLGVLKMLFDKYLKKFVKKRRS